MQVNRINITAETVSFLVKPTTFLRKDSQHSFVFSDRQFYGDVYILAFVVHIDLVQFLETEKPLNYHVALYAN